MKEPNFLQETTKLHYYIARRVKLARKLRNYSQSELAERLGVSYQRISKWENGEQRISATTLVLLSKVLSYPLAFFTEPQS